MRVCVRKTLAMNLALPRWSEREHEATLGTKIDTLQRCARVTRMTFHYRHRRVIRVYGECRLWQAECLLLHSDTCRLILNQSIEDRRTLQQWMVDRLRRVLCLDLCRLRMAIPCRCTLKGTQPCRLSHSSHSLAPRRLLRKQYLRL